MTAQRDIKTQITIQVFLLVLGLVASLWPILVNRVNTQITWTLPEELLLAVTTFVALALVDLIVLNALRYANERSDRRLWEVNDAIDQELTNIRAGLSSVVQESYGEHDLFVRQFRSKLSEVSRQIVDASQKKEIRVVDHHFEDVESVLSAFSADGEKILRYVWVFDGEEPLFDDLNWKKYFEMTAKMVSRREIKVRALLVFSDPSLENSERVRKLFEFFKSNRGFDCRAIAKDQFEEIRNQTPGTLGCIDFGVYGSNLLFRTLSYGPPVEGVFTKDKDMIEKHTRSFDSVWNASHIARPNPVSNKDRVTLATLFEFDSTTMEQAPNTEDSEATDEQLPQTAAVSSVRE